MVYSRVKLDVRVFLGAYHLLMKTIGLDIMAHFAGSPDFAPQRFRASVEKQTRASG